MKTAKMKKIELLLGENIEHYLLRRYDVEKASTVEIGESLGLNHVTVMNWMDCFGIPRRSNAEAHRGELNHQFGKHRERQYVVNDNFFADWSADMAWVVGFICADGNIENDYLYNVIQKEVEPLCKIRDFLAYTGPLSKCGNCHRLRVSNFRHIRDLAAIGIEPRKSLTLQMPQVPEKFFWHFLRGYFDGDGSVYFTSSVSKGKRYERVMVSFVGSDDFIDALNDKISKEMDCASRKPERFKKVSAIKFSGLLAIDVMDRMYADSEEKNRLSRKYSRYIESVAKFREERT